MILESLAALSNQRRNWQQTSTTNGSNRPPPDHPAAPRAPRFCRGGRLCAQRCYVQFPLHGSLVGGAYSNNEPTETPHNIPLGAPPASQDTKKGSLGHKKGVTP